MKRFDRAMYAFFLLALLADFARANVPVSVGGEPAGGLVLSSPRQLRGGVAGGAVLARRRASGSFAAANGFRPRGWALARWAKILSERTHPSTSVVLATTSFGHGFTTGSRFDSISQSAPPSLAVFEHSGSPAP